MNRLHFTCIFIFVGTFLFCLPDFKFDHLNSVFPWHWVCTEYLQSHTSCKACMKELLPDRVRRTPHTDTEHSILCDGIFYEVLHFLGSKRPVIPCRAHAEHLCPRFLPSELFQALRIDGMQDHLAVWPVHSQTPFLSWLTDLSPQFWSS
jgi:hypothetical protein